MAFDKKLTAEEMKALQEIAKPDLQRGRISPEMKANLVKLGYANDLLGGPRPSLKGRMLLKK